MIHIEIQLTPFYLNFQLGKQYNYKRCTQLHKRILKHIAEVLLFSLNLDIFAPFTFPTKYSNLNISKLLLLNFFWYYNVLKIGNKTQKVVSDKVTSTMQKVFAIF